MLAESFRIRVCSQVLLLLYPVLAEAKWDMLRVLGIHKIHGNTNCLRLTLSSLECMDFLFKPYDLAREFCFVHIES